jgi:hypothetical protein
MDLERMRKLHFMPSDRYDLQLPTLGSPQTWKSAEIDPADPMFGDQGLFYAIWKRYPQHFAWLSLAWDMTWCRDS